MRQTVAWLGTALLLAACGESGPVEHSARRGKAVYQTNCIACHNPDPAQPGTLGPPIAGSPRVLVESRIRTATYPEGYTPKRETQLMPPLPHLASYIDDLVLYLAEADGRAPPPATPQAPAEGGRAQ
jgi:mono/diheme cytochrome c family protein